MKKLVMFMILPLFLCLAVAAQAAEKPKDYIFKSMPGYKIDRQSKSFEPLRIRQSKSAKPESKDYTETTYEGNRILTNYSFTGKEKPSVFQIISNYQNAVKKLGGEILWSMDPDSAPNNDRRFHASFMRNDKQYYMAFYVHGSASRYDMTILELEEIKTDVEVINADNNTR